MSFGGKLSACPLLAKANGVALTKGLEENLYEVEDEVPEEFAASLCAHKVDCGDCKYFIAHVENLGIGFEGLGWACYRCITHVKGDAVGALLGFYDDGECSFCGRSALILSAVDRAALESGASP